jgi:hypothetical protein
MGINGTTDLAERFMDAARYRLEPRRFCGWVGDLDFDHRSHRDRVHRSVEMHGTGLGVRQEVQQRHLGRLRGVQRRYDRGSERQRFSVVGVGACGPPDAGPPAARPIPAPLGTGARTPSLPAA